LTWRWPSPTSAAAQHLEADGRGAGERDGRHARVADQRRADLPVALQQADRLGRGAGDPQGLDQEEAAQRRLLGRLEHHGVARRQRRGELAGGDREREVPRRDSGHDAARRVVQDVALAGDLEERAAAAERDGAARRELQEVDGRADLGVGLDPRLADLAHADRGERQVAPVAALVADPDRGRQRQPIVEPGERLGQPVARFGPGQIERGLVAEGREGRHCARAYSRECGDRIAPWQGTSTIG
jgi:hypothetical protein